MDMPKHCSGRTLVSAPLLARTDGYFAPELISRKVSPKSDIYSFGVVSNPSSDISCINLACMIRLKVILETYTGLKAYDAGRTDPELVDDINIILLF